MGETCDAERILKEKLAALKAKHDVEEVIALNTISGDNVTMAELGTVFMLRLGGLAAFQDAGSHHYLFLVEPAYLLTIVAQLTRHLVKLGYAPDLVGTILGKDAVMFRCPRCGRESPNPNDIREKYCGYCHDWTGVAL